MRKFQVLSSFLVSHPHIIEARSVDLLEDEIQAIADHRRTVAGDRYGELQFKHFNKFGRRELHAFFINKAGKKRRFMKVCEIFPFEEAA